MRIWITLLNRNKPVGHFVGKPRGESLDDATNNAMDDLRSDFCNTHYSTWDRAVLRFADKHGQDGIVRKRSK